MSGSIGLIGRKVGMTQVFQEDGTMVAVSGAGRRTEHGHRAAHDRSRRLHRRAARHRTAKQLTKPRAGQLKGLPEARDVREFRVDDVGDYEVGQTLDVGDLFAEGDLVDVTGVSKGKGFAGHIKRHNFRRGPEDPRLGLSSRAGLDRRRHDARQGLPRA